MDVVSSSQTAACLGTTPPDRLKDTFHFFLPELKCKMRFAIFLLVSLEVVWNLLIACFEQFAKLGFLNLVTGVRAKMALSIIG